MISIRRFFITAIVALVLVFYGVFLYYFLNDQQKKTDLILENIRHDLSETAYVVSTEMATPQELREFKSFLHRKVANNPLIAAMAIASGSKILITTEHDIRSAPPKKKTQDKLKGLSAHEMLRYDIYETDIPYFIQNQPAYLKLYLYIDKAYLENYFAENTTNSLLFFFRRGAVTAARLAVGAAETLRHQPVGTVTPVRLLPVGNSKTFQAT